VHISEDGGLAGNNASLYEQAGFSSKVVVINSVCGLLLWSIASEGKPWRRTTSTSAAKALVVLGQDPDWLCRAHALK
jgi:hypothetical protein